jgi:nicotinamidase-related amidase
MKKEMNTEIALLVIDVQEDFREDTEDFPEFENNMRFLLSYARNNGIRVIHVNGMYNPDKSDWMIWARLRGDTVLKVGSGGAKTISYAIPSEGEKRFVKHGFDGFLNTGLDDFLKGEGISCLFICGLITSVCVLTTAISAVQRNYLVSVIGDCCADEKETHDFILKEYAYLVNPVAVHEIGERIASMKQEIEVLKQSS